MTYLGIKTAEDITSIYYKATWDYDFGYMLLFFQQLINEDLKDDLTYAVTGNYDQTTDFLEELLRTGKQLRRCTTLRMEKNYISIAGFSTSMDCDVRLTLWNGTNHVQLEVLNKADLFEQHGVHIFDVYVDSFEILGYMEAVRQSSLTK